MSAIGSRVLARALWVTGLATLARRFVAARGRFVIELHGVPRHTYLELPKRARPSLNASDLDRILTWLSQRLEFLSPCEFLETDRPGVLLTFDDGFANNHDVVLPLLKKFAAPAVFFVTTRHIRPGGRWLDFADEAARAGWTDPSVIPRDAARDLFDGMGGHEIKACAESGLVTIGAHTVSHPRLTRLGDDGLEAEIAGSKAALEDLTGHPVDLFAYPFGDADNRVARAVAAAGFRAAFVEEHRSLMPPHMGIPRVGLHSPASWYLGVKMSGLAITPIYGPGLTSIHRGAVEATENGSSGISR